MSNESIEIAKNFYKSGLSAFESGLYPEAIESLEKASALLIRNTRFGGEVLIWLANAYEGAGRTNDAIAVCEQLKRHPHIDTSKEARRLLYILKAPRLQRPKEWMTEIPDFSNLPDNEGKSRFTMATPSLPPPPKKKPEPEYVDLSQVNTKDNSFVWVALVASALIIGYLVSQGFVSD
jgi:tetratricopeptide (TPR) repeat protein